MRRPRFPARTRRASRDDRGGAIVLVLIIGVLLLASSAMIVARTGTEGQLADRQAEFEGALHAAEAGVHDYIAKLTEDRIYYRHYVHAAEDDRTRKSPATGTYTAGSAWPGDQDWDYPPSKTRYSALKGSATSGYEYNLRIAPNAAGVVTIVATGRRRTSPRQTRTIEVQVKGSSIADYQAIIDADVSYGTTAITTGKIYATGDLDYKGTAYADIISEQTISDSAGTSVIHSPARRCDDPQTYGCDVRVAVKNPIQFSQFTASFAEIKRVAQSSSLGGIYLNDSTKAGWRLTFASNGTVKIESCTGSSHLGSGTAAPTTCTTVDAARAVPALGVIYAEQTVVVSGTLKGRVTIATNQDIVIAGAIDYADATADVIGLLAQVNVFVAEYAPNIFTWRGAVLAQTGAVRYYGSSSSPCNGQIKSSDSFMTFVGSMATKNTPCMARYSGSTLVNGYANRAYNYDPNLSNLQPPFIPVLEEAYVIQRFREIDG